MSPLLIAKIPVEKNSDNISEEEVESEKNKRFTKNKIWSLFQFFVLSLLLGLVVGLLNIQSFLTTLHFYEVDKNIIIGSPVYFFVRVLEVLLLVAPILLLVILMIDINKKSEKRAIKVIEIILMVLVTVPLVISISIKSTTTIKDKRQYEIVSINNKEYAVLSTIDEKELIAEFNYVKENDALYIKKGKYRFIDAHSGENYRYKCYRYVDCNDAGAPDEIKAE